MSNNLKMINGIAFAEWKEIFKRKFEEEKKRFADSDAPTTTKPNHENPILGPNFMIGNAGEMSAGTIQQLIAECSMLNPKWLGGIFDDPTMENHFYWYWRIPADFEIE